VLILGAAREKVAVGRVASCSGKFLVADLEVGFDEDERMQLEIVLAAPGAAPLNGLHFQEAPSL
jgi:predicted secreted protein